MKKFISLVLFTTTLVASNWVNADFESGLKAQQSGDYPTAFEEFKKSANQGDDRAFGKLAGMYLYGLGTEKDYSKAYVWFSIAYKAGDKYAERFKDAASSAMTMNQVAAAEEEVKTLEKSLPPLETK